MHYGSLSFGMIQSFPLGLDAFPNLEIEQKVLYMLYYTTKSINANFTTTFEAFYRKRCHCLMYNYNFTPVEQRGPNKMRTVKAQFTKVYIEDLGLHKTLILLWDELELHMHTRCLLSVITLFLVQLWHKRQSSI